MKKILLIISVLLSVFASAQIPGYTKISARYDWLAGKFDSAFHVPGYSTVPNVRVGAWVGAGNIGVDTVLHRYYFYSGGSWIRLAKYSELIGGGGGGISQLGTSPYGLNIVNDSTYSVDTSSTGLATKPYVRSKVDSLLDLILARMKYSDTASMLANYLRKIDTTIMLAGYKTYYPRSAISLTTTGTSGAATYNPSTGVFNIPQYTAGSNMANANQTVTGNRIHDLNSFYWRLQNGGDDQFVVDPAGTYQLGGSSQQYIHLTNSLAEIVGPGGVTRMKINWSGNSVFGDVDDNLDGMKIKFDGSGFSYWGAVTFSDSTHWLINEAGHYSTFNTRQRERVRVNESGILIPNGIMPTTGSGGTDSAWFRNSSTGQTYLAPAASTGTLTRIGTLNSQTKSVKGAVASGDSIVMQTFDDSTSGLVPSGGDSTKVLIGNATWKKAAIIDTTNRSDSSLLMWDSVNRKHVYIPYIVSSGGGPATSSPSYLLQFKVDETPNAPADGDSLLTCTSFGGYVNVFRNGEHQQYNDTLFGYEYDTTAQTVTFHPPLESGERVQIYTNAFRDTISLDPPAGLWDDVTYPTNDWLVNTAGVITESNPGSGSFDPIGLSAVPFTGDGYYIAKYVASDMEACILGFNASNTLQQYNNYEVCFYIAPGSGGAVTAIESGSGTGTGYTLSTNEYIAIHRVGSTFTIETSMDKSSWTVRYTFTYSSSATHYMTINLISDAGKLYYPQVNQ